jgi:radical SAM-linked protein
MGMKKTHDFAPSIIYARKIKNLSADNYPAEIIIPNIEIVHDRVGIEIMRGCSRGCRFCAAGYFYRPVRERPQEEIMEHLEKNIRNSGWQEVSLLSLSSSDYSCIIPLLSDANSRLSPMNINLTLPSLRADTLTSDMLDPIIPLRKSSLTIAPEAGSQRLRNIIGKNLSEEEILSSIRTAFVKGWSSLKLYFMIGLPFEKDEDIDALIDLIRKIRKTALGENNRARIHVSISPFSPKPHTPFQWAAQDDSELLRQKIKKIKSAVSSGPVEVTYASVTCSLLESVLARGNRKIAEVIHNAFLHGARLDGWTEHFNFELWKRAFTENSLRMEDCVKEIPQESALPWDVMQVVDKNYLKAEFENAKREIPSVNCRDTKVDLCCGVCKNGIARSFQTKVETGNSLKTVSPGFGRRAKLTPSASTHNPVTVTKNYRAQFTKELEARFLGHFDVMRIMERAFRRAELPLAFSQGFHPHPKLAFSSPVTLGFESRAEFFDVEMNYPLSSPLERRMNSFLPVGIKILSSCPIMSKALALSADICASDYVAKIPNDLGTNLESAIALFLEQSQILVVRNSKSGDKTVNIRPLVLEMKVINQNQATPIAELFLRLSMGEQGFGRPAEILKQLLPLRQETELLKIRILRTAQWINRGGELISPVDFS